MNYLKTQEALICTYIKLYFCDLHDTPGPLQRPQKRFYDLKIFILVNLWDYSLLTTLESSSFESIEWFSTKKLLLTRTVSEFRDSNLEIFFNNFVIAFDINDWAWGFVPFYKSLNELFLNFDFFSLSFLRTTLMDFCFSTYWCNNSS